MDNVQYSRNVGFGMALELGLLYIYFSHGKIKLFSNNVSYPLHDSNGNIYFHICCFVQLFCTQATSYFADSISHNVHLSVRYPISLKLHSLHYLPLFPVNFPSLDIKSQHNREKLKQEKNLQQNRAKHYQREKNVT